LHRKGVILNYSRYPVIENIVSACIGAAELARIRCAGYMPPSGAKDRLNREREIEEYEKMVLRFHGIYESQVLSQYLKESGGGELRYLDAESFVKWAKGLRPLLFLSSRDIVGGFCHVSYAIRLPDGSIDKKRRACCGELAPFVTNPEMVEDGINGDREIMKVAQKAGFKVCKLCADKIDNRIMSGLFYEAAS
jgi:hypothetical protein